MHLALNELVKRGDVPKGLHVAHIMEATARVAAEIYTATPAPAPRVVLWSSIATAQSGLYHAACAANGIPDLEVPSAGDSAKVEELIELTKQGKIADAMVLTAPLLAALPRGTIMVMGCTELPLLKTEMERVTASAGHQLHFVDCNLSLAESVVATYKSLLSSSASAGATKVTDGTTTPPLRTASTLSQPTTPTSAVVSPSNTSASFWETMRTEDWVDTQSTTNLQQQHAVLCGTMLPELLAAEMRDGTTRVIVDLGCGEGEDIFEIARTALEVAPGVDFECLGIDFNEDFCASGRASAKANGLSECVRFTSLDLTAPTYRAALDETAPAGKRLFTFLGNAMGIIPRWALALANVARGMRNGERLLLVSHDARQLESTGIPIVYSRMVDLIGRVDLAESDIPNGLFVAKSGYTSQWFSPAMMDAAVAEHCPGLRAVRTTHTVDMDTYGLYEQTGMQK